MKSRILAFSAVALLSANVAHAGAIFDTATGITPSGFDGPESDATTVMADSFHSTATSFTVQLLLSAGDPGDGGSASVYLVPDDGTGGAAGMAGDPIAAFLSGNFTGSQLVGTVSDSALTGTPSLQSFDVSNSPLTTQNGEYWLALVSASTTSSSVQWSYNADGSGIGTDNQAWGNNYLDPGTDPGPWAGSTSDSSGPYALSVVPEPASMAMLGAGLAGLGFLRRRKSV